MMCHYSGAPCAYLHEENEGAQRFLPDQLSDVGARRRLLCPLLFYVFWRVDVRVVRGIRAHG
jgi:hypothetical protein